MGLSRLLGLYLAVFFISSVNFANANYIYDAPTRTWMPTSSTVLAPPNSGSVFAPARGSGSPTVNNGGFTTPSSGSFRSPPVNGSSYRVPVTLDGSVSKANVNKAVASRLLRGGLAGVVLGAGLDALLDGIGGLIDEGGQLVMAPTNPQSNPNNYSPPLSGYYRSSSGTNHDSASGACAVTAGCLNYGACTPIPLPSNPNANEGWCVTHGTNGYGTWRRVGSLVCTTGDLNTKYGCLSGNSLVPPTPTQLEGLVDNNYQPDPSDYPTLVSEPDMRPTVVGVGPIPPVEFPPVTTTTTDSDTGQTTTTETTTTIDFGIVDNDTEQPKIVSEETTTTVTYTDGIKTSESTTTSSSGAQTGSSPVATEINIPTDCDFMPTVCAFIDWVKDMTTEPEPDLSVLLTDQDYEQNYTIDFGSETCPEPIEINISFINQTVQLSYQPACDFVGYARPLILISAYLFAIYIGLGVVRNG